MNEEIEVFLALVANHGGQFSVTYVPEGNTWVVAAHWFPTEPKIPSNQAHMAGEGSTMEEALQNAVAGL